MSDKLESIKSAATALITLLDTKLLSYKDKALTSPLCTEIYNSIFETTIDVFKKASIAVDNETMNWICQMFYDNVTIGTPSGAGQLDPNIFTQRAKLENIKTQELAFVYVMFKDHLWLIEDIVKEIKKRN